MNRFVLPGAGVCAALALLSLLGVGPLGLLELLFLLAAWVIVPLGLAFVPAVPPVRLARKLQPVAAALATVVVGGRVVGVVVDTSVVDGDVLIVVVVNSHCR